MKLPYLANSGFIPRETGSIEAWLFIERLCTMLLVGALPNAASLLCPYERDSSARTALKFWELNRVGSLITVDVDDQLAGSRQGSYRLANDTEIGADLG